MTETRTAGPAVPILSSGPAASPEPRVLRARNGYLAVTPGKLSPKIGVMGATEEDAVARFACAWKRWMELLAEADAYPPVTGL